MIFIVKSVVRSVVIGVVFSFTTTVAVAVEPGWTVAGLIVGVTVKFVLSYPSATLIETFAAISVLSLSISNVAVAVSPAFEKLLPVIVIVADFDPSVTVAVQLSCVFVPLNVTLKLASFGVAVASPVIVKFTVVIAAYPTPNTKTAIIKNIVINLFLFFYNIFYINYMYVYKT